MQKELIIATTPPQETKIAILEARAHGNLALWHPDDLPMRELRSALLPFRPPVQVPAEQVRQLELGSNGDDAA